MMTSEQVRELAAQLYVRYMDDDGLLESAQRICGAGAVNEYIAERSFEDAEAFAKVAAERKESPGP